jgi:ribosomal protein S18 acetylase RimI-like enzyme
MTLEILPAQGASDLRAIEVLADEIWREHYTPLIGAAQVEYMLAKFQSAAAMEAQIQEGYEYFVVRRDGHILGYLAVQAQPGERLLFISKFYVHKSARGSGTGRACMEFIEGLARQRGLDRLWLTVNKANPAVKAYERLGFSIARPLVTDIGGGFVMNDYRMEKALVAD